MLLGDPRSRRRASLQYARRRQEKDVRLNIVTVVEQAYREGLTLRSVAQAVGIPERTLRHWRQGAKRCQLPDRLRGRPCRRCSLKTRNAVIRFLHHVTGPVIGLPALRALFPNVPRCVLHDLLTRYRKVWRGRYCPWGFRLTWHVPGSTWAMDFSKASYPIDGEQWYIFAVRDLASGYQLAWEPVHGERADEARGILKRLFKEHGPPLVLKSDNGSAFIAERIRELLEQQQVAQLFSPAGRPSFNGGLERSNHVNKMYTAQHALSAGHEHQWLASDLQAARQLANRSTRPWGHQGPTPQEVWEQRERLTPEQRQTLLQKLAEKRVVSAAALGIDSKQSLDHTDRSRLDRHALSAVFKELGYLTQKRGQRFTKKPKRATRKQIEQRVAKHNHKPDATPTPIAIADALPPALGSRPCADNARRSTPCAPASAAADAAGIETSSEAPQRDSTDAPPSHQGTPPPPQEKVLAETVQAVTMQADRSTIDVTPEAVAQCTTAHQERTFTSWWRGLITLPLTVLKAANIMR